MKCISCEVEINPKWKHAIDINVCPFCGQGIMEEHLKNLLTSLRETMEKLSEYPDQVNDWMLSNYDYIKTDSPNIINYVPQDTIKDLYKDMKRIDDEEKFLEKKRYTVKVKTESGEEEIETEKIQSDERTNDFFKRAEVKLTIDKDENNPSSKRGKFSSVSEKTEHLKNLKKQIEQEGSPAVVNEAGLAAMISPADMESTDPATMAEIQALVEGGGISSSLPDIGDDDEIPSVVLAMARRSQGKGADPNADLAKLHDMQSRVQESKRNFAGAKGSFSRS